MAKANNDFNITEQDITTQVAAITTRDIQAIPNPTAGIFQKVDVDEAYRVDAKPFIERPFYCDTVKFSDTADQYSVLDSKIKFLPGDVARSNPSLLNMFKMAGLGRPDLVLNLSMAGTISHAGCILAGIIPPLPSVGGTAWLQGQVPQLVNTLMTGPHAFLNANEATSVTLHVPWYCNYDLMSLDFEKSSDNYESAMDLNYVSGNYGTLVMMVLNPLSVADGASTTINIVVEACFKNFDMVVPTPRYLKWSAQARPAKAQNKGGFMDSLRGFATGLFDYTTNGLKSVATDGLDSVRGWLRSWTGLHNPNMAIINERAIVAGNNFLNNTATPQYFEKIDYNPLFSRIVKEPIFGNDMDEMSMSHITAKDQYLGTFSVGTDDEVGSLKWIRPISPFSGGKLVTVGAEPDTRKFLRVTNNLDLIHSLTRAWRGGLKLKIQSVMNNKQQVKLKVIKYYNPSGRIWTEVPDYSTIVNAPSHLLEFTQGGQTHEVSLPYLCRNELTPCHDDPSFEAFFHGVYYIYVAQPLCVADGSPTKVNFNVYIAGDDDLAFYGQNIRALTHADWELLSLDGDYQAQAGTVPGMEVMNSPQEQIQQMGEDNKESMATYCNRLLPLVDVRPICRRMAPIFANQVNIPANSFTIFDIDLASVVGERRTNDFGDAGTNYQLIPLNLISSMYYGKTPGFKIRLDLRVLFKEDEQSPLLAEDQRLEVKAYYVPPQINFGRQGSQWLFQSSLPAFGATELPIPLVASNEMFDTSNRSVEFEVPFTHLMKYLGGPDKFRDWAEGATSRTKTTANSDAGTVGFYLINHRLDRKAAVRATVYAGVNDETRFGMHSIAPLFYRQPSATMYQTNYSGVTKAPDDALPSNLYRGGYTA